MDNFHTIDDDFDVDDNIILTNKQYDLISDGYYNLRQLHSKLNGVVDPKILEPLTNMLTILGDEVIDPHFKSEARNYYEF